MTGTAQEQQKVLEEFKTNDKELKQFYEMVKGYWQEQEQDSYAYRYHGSMLIFFHFPY